MIVVMQSGIGSKEIDAVMERLVEAGLKGSPSQGVERTVIGVVGKTFPDLKGMLESLPGVEEVVPISKPYKQASREFREGDTVIKVGDVSIGGGNVVVMAGPCAVESEEQTVTTAKAVKASGAHMLRGGAFKPRTSPYSFRGLEDDGLKILATAREETGLPVVTEIMSEHDIDLVYKYADVLQVGARNMQNYMLLDELGKLDKPVMIKRAFAGTMEEWLLCAEYVLAGGNTQVILCERGIRTFETVTRNTLDLSAVPMIKRLSHLPVVSDPSHGTGKWYLVDPMALASVVVGADGLIIEVHPNPDQALSDGPQSLTLENFDKLMKRIDTVGEAVGRPLHGYAAQGVAN